MGVDTVKLSYRLRDSKLASLLNHDEEYLRERAIAKLSKAFTETGEWESRVSWSGRQGPCSYQGYRYAADDTMVTVKGIRHDPVILWEGSVPKALGITGSAEPGAVRIWDAYLRRIMPWGLPVPAVRRCDVTEDVYDPDGELLRAAIGWKPHARSRYVQALYASGDEVTTNPYDAQTVFLHNKCRGVRVYAKFPECGQEWARDLTRVEYQVRGSWVEKLMLDRMYARDFSVRCQDAVAPLVAELNERTRRDAADGSSCREDSH